MNIKKESSQIVNKKEKYKISSGGRNPIVNSKLRPAEGSSEEALRRNRPRHYCELCGKSFKRGHNLKIHGRMHSGVTPYSCPYPNCEKEFRWKSSIVSHKKWHKYKCNDVLPEEICSGTKSSVRSVSVPDPLQEDCSKEIKLSAIERDMNLLAEVDGGLGFLGSPVSSLLTCDNISDAELDLSLDAFDGKEGHGTLNITDENDIADPFSDFVGTLDHLMASFD